MANKSSHHKETNTFKFQNFAEKLSNVRVYKYRAVVHENEIKDAEQLSCFFRQELLKWNELDLTEGFKLFRREVSSVITLEQLVFKKDQVIESILKHLKLRKALQPLLALTSALAEDLLEDFYPYFYTVLFELIEILNTREVEVIEWTFHCIADLFKLLWKSIKNDSENFMINLLPLLEDSKPEYINKFAAEVISFVVRKIKSRREFLSFLIKTVEKKPNCVRGCSRLFFEVIFLQVGDNEPLFHSCHSAILPLYFELLEDDHLPRKTVYEILESTVLSIVSHVPFKSCSAFWKYILESVDMCHKNITENKNENGWQSLEYILKLIEHSVNYKHGRSLAEPERLASRLIKLCEKDVPEAVYETISNIAASLLLSPFTTLTQETSSRLVFKILCVKYNDDFIRKVIPTAAFESLILPQFLEYCLRLKFDTKVFFTLTKIITFKSRIDGVSYLEWQKYPLDFSSSKQTQYSFDVSEYLLSLLEIDTIDEKYVELICALICLPHINLNNTELVQEKLVVLIKHLYKQENDDFQKQLFLLFVALEAAVRLLDTKSIEEVAKPMLDKLLSFATDVKYISVLKIVGLILTFTSEDFRTMALLEKLRENLTQNLSSPFHKVRYLTTYIFTLFEHCQELNVVTLENKEPWQMFTLCFDAERINPSPERDREQINLMDKLSYESRQAAHYKNTTFKDYPLRYLLGALYMNYTRLWNPIIKIISTHAYGMDTDDFWGVFNEHLKISTEYTKNPVVLELPEIDFSCDTINELYCDLYRIIDNNNSNDKPDFVEHRIQLWKAMAEFSEIVEMKNRDVVALFLDFVTKEEIGKITKFEENDEVASKKRKRTHSDENDTAKETMDVDEIDYDENVSNSIDNSLDSTLISSKSMKADKKTIKTVTACLSLFAKIQSPASMHREPELYKVYLDFLMHENSKVQKGALDCITKYKHKYPEKYRTKLYSLIDDRSFKNELDVLCIDIKGEIEGDDRTDDDKKKNTKEKNLTEKRLRQDLLPIILRIVYSKMRSGGKSEGNFRRSSVMRFLSCLQEDEVLMFVQVTFKHYATHIQDDAKEMVQNIINAENFNRGRPKLLQSTVNLLKIALNELGSVWSDKLLSYLLRVLLCVGATVANNYNPYYREVRNSCLETLESFFKRFEAYSWTQNEIDAVFDVFVWPWLDKLNIEGIHSPTALFNLFLRWSYNPRYYVLLVKCRSDSCEQYVLPHVVKLLMNEKTNFKVICKILELIEQLLTLQSSEEDESVPEIKIDSVVKTEVSILEKLDLTGKINFGSTILLPFIPDIIEYLHRKIAKKSKSINRRDLRILSRISELVWESDISDSLLKVLLPILIRTARGASEETVERLVTTICHLIVNVNEPERHIKTVAPLFGLVSGHSARKLLCKFLTVVSDKSTAETKDRLKTLASIISELNAWDAKWVDKPDFERRMNAFNQLGFMVTSKTIDCDLGIIAIHNCFHFIRSEEDYSIRDAAGHHLKLLASALSIKYQNDSNIREYIVNNTLIRLICSGIRDKNDRVRDQAILLLGHMVIECPSVHPVLRDLENLANKTDKEVDFFENLTHLQLHRHSRALLKFCQASKQLYKAPNPRTLTQIILPITEKYLCNDKYASKNSMIDSAIDTVITVCRLLPWHQYEAVLKDYLSKLRYKVEYRKQLVRIVCGIIDAFHFDLSRADKSVLVEAQKKIEEADKNKPVEEEVESGKVEEKSLDEDEIVFDKTAVDEFENEKTAVEEEDGEEEEIVSSEEKSITVMERQIILCPSAAKRLIYNVSVGLLPQLNRSMAQLNQHDVSHKLNKKKARVEKEEEDLLRVPIALAFVKLLKKLPAGMDFHLPGIFMKLCTFLKSHLESVRRVTREMLQEIMITLGPKYLTVLLDVMSSLLTRGYQIHVLVYTAHGVLSSLKRKDLYKVGDIDICLKTVLEMCKTDIFGAASEEKEVTGLINKVSEAKTTKSFDTFQILAQFISKESLSDLLMPIKDIIVNSNVLKKINKAQECLRRIVEGLIENLYIPAESLLIFAHGIASESIPEFVAEKNKPILTEAEREKLGRQRVDCFILQEEPKTKFGEIKMHAKNSKRANAHILVEFGLRLCFYMLKRDKLKELDSRPYLDPFVPVLLNCLKSQHVKMCALTLQCLGWFFKIELPQMKQNIKEFTACIFTLLHKYAAAGLSKGDNFDLVMAAFKSMSILVRDAKYFKIETEQLKALLLYAEQDLYDYDRQASAFGLLKSIIARKLQSNEIHAVMKKVASLSITSELPHIRTQARQVFHQYLMDYPLGKKRLDEHLAFCMAQLKYELQFGRESAIETMLSIINSFPMHVLVENSAAFFIVLGERLVNDESPECKKMIANCIKTMLLRLTKVDRDKIFEIILEWLKAEKLGVQTVAVQTCGLFIQVEKSDFEKRLKQLLPLLSLDMDNRNLPGRFVRLKPVTNNEEKSEEKEREKDHFLFLLYQMLLKLCALCPTFLKQTEHVEMMALSSQVLLAYPHQWVRLAAAQFLGFVMSSLDPEKLSSLLLNGDSDPGYLTNDPQYQLKSLSLDLVAQLQTGIEDAALAEQVVKNLVFIARVLKDVPIVENGNFSSADAKINLLWMTKRMRKVVNAEISQTPSVTVLRNAVFKWIAGICVILDKEKINEILYHLLAPIVRELNTTEECYAELRHFAFEVSKLIKNKVSIQVYTKVFTQLEGNLDKKRAIRKRIRAQQMVTDPEMAAKRKIRLQAKKKELKKRKISDLKQGKKKRRKVNRDNDD